MSGAPLDLPPPIPTELAIYNSYVIDPRWQRKFTAIWTGALAVCILLSIPSLLLGLRKYGWKGTLTGVSERWGNHPKTRKGARGWVFRSKFFPAVLLWTIPQIGLDVGQLIVLVAYFVVLLICVSMQAPLIDNPNRAGFLALAQLPLIFLFATKNSIFSFLLGPGNGWEKINYLHRWAGRGMFLCATVHGSLWIRNHLQYGLPILGQQKETSGVASFALLCVIVLSSLQPVRYFAYQVFFVIHILAFVAFYITVCYHTIYASPWIFPPLAFYGLDMLMRMFRSRFKDATLIAHGDQFTQILVHDTSGGWIPGQHVRLCAFIDGRITETHPLTISSAPSDVSVCNADGEIGTMVLGARVCGDWSRALNKYATEFPISKVEDAQDEKGEPGRFAGPDGAFVQVSVDGPYGGCSIDIGDFEHVVLFAGGSGVTFMLGLLDDIVGRSVRQGEPIKTKKIELVWCVKTFGCIDWATSQLSTIVRALHSNGKDKPPIHMHVTVYVTCLCDRPAKSVLSELPPGVVKVIAESRRPDVYRTLCGAVSIASHSGSGTKDEDMAECGCGCAGEQFEDEKSEESNSDKKEKPDTSSVDSRPNSPVRRAMGIKDGESVAVCAAGPDSLVREAKNAVARLALGSIGGTGPRLGDIGYHMEVYSL